jgi:peptidoglycan/xylan/chitin deacetylase (PgdA/CDA1 family)
LRAAGDHPERHAARIPAAVAAAGGRPLAAGRRLVAQHVVGKVGRGDIIDLHDGIGRGTFVPASDLAAELMRRRQVEVEALPEIIERLAQRGIHLGTVSDLRSARDGWVTA